MGDTGIVRNRLKVDAAIPTRPPCCALREDGGLDDARLVARARRAHARRSRPADCRPPRPESVALAKALKRAGFVFVGPTTMYAAMQACGLVDDHLVGCHRAGRAR